MDRILIQLNTIEKDQKRLENIRQLENAFNEVKSSYANEYNNTLAEVNEKIKTKLKENAKIRDVVNKYVRTYAKPEVAEEATDMLYNLLSAELAMTLQTLSHTSCIIS